MDILLIAAEWKARAALNAQLQEEGYELSTWPSLHETMRWLIQRPHPIRLVLLDLVGLDADEQSLQDFRRLVGETPILLLTGAYTPDWQELLRPVHTLRRPWQVSEVIRAVRKILGPPFRTTPPR